VLDINHISTNLEDFLAEIGQVFVVHRGHDSGNTSYGVRVGGQPWFVKYTEVPDAVRELESAIRFHRAVRHPAIVPLAGFFRTSNGLAVVHEWADGEVLNDPLAPGSLPREHPESAHQRFKQLRIDEIVEALDTVFDAHVAAAARGFVAVDFYDGAIIYDFTRRAVHLCDLDSYCPGPYLLQRDRQFGSTRFMAPEEWQRGARIDERTTVFTLGRCAFVFLSAGGRGEPERERWRASTALHEVATTATRADRRQRYASVAELQSAWRAAAVR
jgi:serine/threonine-protein kinase